MARRPVALASTLALILSAGLPGAHAATGVTLTPVDKVYAQAGKSLVKLGLYHLKTRTTRTEGTSTVVSTEEDWVDVGRAVARTYSVFDVHAKGAAPSFAHTATPSSSCMRTTPTASSSRRRESGSTSSRRQRRACAACCATGRPRSPASTSG